MNFFPARSSALNAFDVRSTASVAPIQDKGSLTVPVVGLGRASQSLLFIDGGVQDYSQLVAGVAAGTEVHILDPVQDAVSQITQALLGREGISSLHIVSHGESGGLDFGGSRLNLTDLPGYAAQLQSWGQALTADADILLYGCDVAQGELGQAFVSILSQLTGADMAASDDLTGSGALGGDWTLEFNTGQIESGLAFRTEAIADYGGVLADNLAFAWAKSGAGSGSTDESYGVGVDGQGNVYTAGSFGGTIDFGSGSISLTSKGANDIFISKRDGSGNLVWVKQIGGDFNDRNDLAYSLQVDRAGNVYTTGLYQDTVDFGGGTVLTGGTYEYNVFVSKLDTNGDLVWAKKLGGSGLDVGQRIALDQAGNVYTTGYFGGTADFDPGTGTASLSSAGGGDIFADADVFVSKLDSNGNFVWAKSFGNTGVDRGFGLTTDSAGNVYTTGYFGGTVDFDPGTGTANLSSTGNADVFVSKLDSNGNFVWAKSFGSSEEDLGTSVITDQTGNVYVSGIFKNTIAFGSSPGIAPLISNGDRDAFLTKFDSNGNLLWAKGFGGSGEEIAYDLQLDSFGNIYAIGNFSNSVNFNPGGTPTVLNSRGDRDAFLTKFDSNSNLLWAGQMGGSGNDLGYRLSLDADNVYTTGHFSGTANFDPNGAGTPAANLVSQGGYDGFVTKLNQIPTVTLTTSDSTAAEAGNNTGTYRIARNSTAGNLTVKLNLSGGPDLNSTDYTLSGGSLTIAGNIATIVIPTGQSFVDLTFTAVDDIQAEADESLTLNLVSDSAYTLGSSTTSAVTIAQNDFVVINTQDAGEGSLRQAIINANAIAGNDTITFAGSTFTDAAADTIGLTSGELGITSNITINGTGANLLTVSGRNASRVLTIGTGTTVVLNGITIANGNSGLAFGGGINNQGNLTGNNGVLSGNYAQRQGAGIWNSSILTVNTTTFTNNSTDTNRGPGGGGAGGGIFNNGGTVTVNTSSFTQAAVRDGGGIFNSGGTITVNSSSFTNTQSNGGGGIFNGAGTVTINNSTVSGNRAYGWGAGLWNATGATMSLNNSTVSGNSSGVGGGGVWNEGGNLTLNNSTFTNNSAGSYGGGIWSNSTVRVGNSIIGGNSARTGPEVSIGGGTFTSNGYNLVGQNGNAGGFTTSATDIVLAGAIGTAISTLANNGGPTQTHALLPGSAAINAAGTGATATDQRGIAAVGNRDIGAFESRGFSITAIGGTPQSALPTAAFTAPLVSSVSSAFGEPVDGGTVIFTAPNTGASTTVTSQTATIAAGQVSVSETANSLVGNYTVTASANGIATPANFNLTNANTRPVVTNFNGAIGREDTPLNFATTDFTSRFSDANGDRLTKIQITSLPTQGSLQLGGSTVSLNQEITTAQLSTLSYIPNPNSNGPDSFGWNGSDGTDYATTSATVNLTIAPVNDAPSFTKGANQTAIAGSSVRTVLNWATNFIPGPSDEAGQAVQQYQIVSNSNPGLFRVQPTIDSTGKLTYTPVRRLDRTQTATLILQVKDNGGIDNGGIDTSATQSFTITVNPRIVPILTVFQSLPKLSKSSQRLLASQPPALRQLFDEEFYLRQNPDVAAAVARRSFQSGFEHFLRNGQYEGRDPSGLYNDRYYLSQNPDVAAAVKRGNFRSGFQHFLRYGEYEGRNASTLYNEQTYLSENPDVAAAVARGNFRSGLQHFLQHGFAEGRVPNLTLFNERYYLNQNPDVAAAVSRGRFTSGLQHFERFGQFEGRQPSTLFNERYYLSQNPDVAAAVARGQFKSGFDHFLDFGRFEGRAGID